MDNRTFNELFGDHLAGARVGRGCKSATKMAHAIEDATGKKFPAETLQRIERGKQPMTVEQYAMFYQTLYGMPPELLVPRYGARMTDGVVIDATR